MKMHKMITAGAASALALTLTACVSTEDAASDVDDCKSTEAYAEICESEPTIDERLAGVDEGVEIPGDGHVQLATANSDSDNREMQRDLTPWWWTR